MKFEKLFLCIVVLCPRHIGNLMDDKITIIEGPPPVFEQVNDGWAMGLNESPNLSVPALTRLRTFNGPALVQRCYNAWHNKSSILLHRSEEHTSELQSLTNLVCRLLLEKKKKHNKMIK